MSTNFSSWCWHLKLVSLLAIGGAIATPIDWATAQIAPDTTLGAESSVVTPNVNIDGMSGDRIDGGAIWGTNLFHSFEQFSVLTGREAFFNNAADVQNIISRVTGSSISNIDGLIRANGTANLFLLNPNGIIFGPNASLDVMGSFVASTASSLNFADGTQFSATAPQTTPQLTVSVPLGLQFGRPAASIQMQAARLQVPSGETLGLVGGDVTLVGGRLGAAGGRIELGSVAGPVTPVAPVQVSLTPVSEGWALGYEGISSFGDIRLSNAAAVDASGAGGGDIQVWGRQVTLTNGSQIEASTQGAEPGGTLSIRASESVEAINTTADGRVPSGIFNQVYPGATGVGGNLDIATDRLLILNGAQIGTGTFGLGAAGNLTVSATESVELSGSSATGQISSRLATDVGLGVIGAGGNLNIGTRRLIVRDGGQITALTRGTGSGGTLTVKVSDSVELSGTSPVSSELVSGILTSVQPEASGNAGDLNLETQRLIIRNGAALSTATFGEGSGGTLTVKVYESVELIGESQDGQSPSGLFAVSGRENVFTEAKGQGGSIQIDTPQLLVQDGAAVTVSSTSTASDAKGADNIDITAQTIRLDQGAIAAETASGNGGNITLHNPDLLLLRHQSNISTSAGTAGSGGTGGNINIDNAQFIVAIPSENSDIKANAFLGQGGEVTITAQSIFGLAERNLEDLQTLLNTNDPTQLDPIYLSSSDITAISQTDPSLSGQVTINTPDVDPSRGLVNLPTDLIDASGLIAQSCASDAESVARNEFIITGRGGLPPNPTEPLNGEAVLTNWATLEPDVENRSSVGETALSSTRKSVPNQIVEAQGWVTDAAGDVVLTATAPTVTSHIPSMNPATCHGS